MLLPLLALAAAAGPQEPDTRAWWAITAALSSDAMEGRDTGSPGYDRAAALVARRFAAAGLKPAGEKGSWFQRVPMEELRLRSATLTAGRTRLRFLHDITVAPAEAMPTRLSAPIAYRGYCGAASLGDVRGKAVICHGSRKPGLPGDAERLAALKAAGAAAIVTISDPGFTVEPPRWPFAYARSVRLAGPAPAPEPLLRFTLNAAALGKMIAGSGRSAARLVEAGARGAALPSFDIPAALRARFSLERRSIASPNILAWLPGTDPALADQAILLSAHLDGYGYGEPVDGDALYNGTLDDAAYVALLIRLAEQRRGKGFRRPILFAVWTGEEKGLLGSRWFAGHPTLPLARIAANVNLDQLRPIFPLELLTVHALDDTSLGDDARAVAGAMGIAVQADPEPERNLLRRSDNWPFMEKGIPATGFVFGYRPGSESERIYRQWYRTGYHKPQDDLHQRMDWKAAAEFNLFFYRLVDRVADGTAKPDWKPGSVLRKGLR
jgi:Zn-dependent M28 family amino/carboxypeptidase